MGIDSNFIKTKLLNKIEFVSKLFCENYRVLHVGKISKGIK